jgi:hypothetical protein
MLCALFGVGLCEFDEHSCHGREGFARNDFVAHACLALADIGGRLLENGRLPLRKAGVANPQWINKPPPRCSNGAESCRDRAVGVVR